MVKRSSYQSILEIFLFKFTLLEVNRIEYCVYLFVMLISLPPVEAPVMAPKIMSSIGMPIKGSRTEKHYFFHLKSFARSLVDSGHIGLLFLIHIHIYMYIVQLYLLIVFCRQRNIDFHDCDVSSLQRSHCNQWTLFLAIVLLHQ